MRTRLHILLLLLSLTLPSLSWAELDLDREVIVIPDTHNEKPYVWNVLRNPGDYRLSLEYEKEAMAGADTEFRFTVTPMPDEKMADMNVFIADSDLHTYRHLKPAQANGAYRFLYNAPRAGKYRFEVVFRTAKGWVDLRKDVTIRGDRETSAPDKKAGDDDYAVNIKLYPKKIYAEHVGTFLYEISYKGQPLKDIEKVEGADMQVAAWDEDLKEFIFATPKQNLGGPEVAVSLVFMRPGKHAIFAEFKHRGVVRTIDSSVNVLLEPRGPGGFLPYLSPSE